MAKKNTSVNCRFPSAFSLSVFSKSQPGERESEHKARLPVLRKQRLEIVPYPGGGILVHTQGIQLQFQKDRD